MRPLIGFDKLDIIGLAQRIGTYETSIVHEPDCCTLFMPAHPILRGNLAACERAEAELDVEGLARTALEEAELYEDRGDGTVALARRPERTGRADSSGRSSAER